MGIANMSILRNINRLKKEWVGANIFLLFI